MTGVRRVAVIGVGYVGLPLVLAFADAGYDTVGFDIDEQRIRELTAGVDRRGGGPVAAHPGRRFRADAAALGDRDCFVVTVPTPVTGDRRPDLGPLRAACATVRDHLRPGGLVIVESSVDPGTTREVCLPILESTGLRGGTGFGLAYAPERISPGEHADGVRGVARVVGGHDAAARTAAAALYRSVTAAPVHEVSSLEAAELSKMAENAQRDLNIAFANEIAMLCARIGLSSREVLDAAATKWNFHRYEPGLVGGHCIAVDPYYLAERSRRAGVPAAAITAGRAVNERMPAFVAGEVLRGLRLPAGREAARIGVLGLTYKADVPDTRNSGVPVLAGRLAAAGHRVLVHDPVADGATVSGRADGTKLVPLDDLVDLDALVLAVRHRRFAGLGGADLGRMLCPGGLVADLSGMVRGGDDLPAGVRLWSL